LRVILPGSLSSLSLRWKYRDGKVDLTRPLGPANKEVRISVIIDETFDKKIKLGSFPTRNDR